MLQAQLLELRSQSISDENQSLKRAKELQKLLELSQHQHQETVAGETLKAECVERQLTQVIGCWLFLDSCSARQSVSYMSAACQHIINTQSIYNRYTIGTHSQHAHSITQSARTAIHSQRWVSQVRKESDLYVERAMAALLQQEQQAATDAKVCEQRHKQQVAQLEMWLLQKEKALSNATHQVH